VGAGGFINILVKMVLVLEALWVRKWVRLGCPGSQAIILPKCYKRFENITYTIFKYNILSFF